MKNIVMVENNSLGVILYTYRIEFQKRGHPHAHGCLWIDINKMDKEFPGLKAAFQSLRHNRKLQEATVSTPLLERLPSSLKQTNALVNWIDKYTTCSLNKAKVGEMAAQRARELQTHGHTATCHKKCPECRCVCVPVCMFIVLQFQICPCFCLHKNVNSKAQFIPLYTFCWTLPVRLLAP